MATLAFLVFFIGITGFYSFKAVRSRKWGDLAVRSFLCLMFTGTFVRELFFNGSIA